MRRSTRLGLRNKLVWVFLGLLAAGACALLEQGSGEFEHYKYEEVR